MHETVILLRDNGSTSKIRTGRLQSKEDAFEFAKEIHRFVFGRNNNDYAPPNMDDMLLSSL
jgi:hypothetical protein